MKMLLMVISIIIIMLTPLKMCFQCVNTIFLPGVKCQATKADIILVVDSSGSIGTENFDKVRNFLKDLVNSLDIDPSLTRVGLMLFNDKATWQFKLNRYGDKFEMLKVLTLCQ